MIRQITVKVNGSILSIRGLGKQEHVLHELPPCNGYLGHPFEKEDLWTVIANLFFSVRGTEPSIQQGNRSHPQGKNREVWAASSHERHARTAGESCKRPLEACCYELDGPGPSAGRSHSCSRFRLPNGSHDEVHP
jgi:hypothetical protein